MLFSKDKTTPLKAAMALLIVADHLTFQVDLLWLRPFRELGAPIVSVFFFISGYGLMKSFQAKGSGYLNGFWRKRIWKVILPSLIALAFYYLLTWQSRDYLNDFKLLFTHGCPLLPSSWFVEVIVLEYIGFWATFKFLPSKVRLPAIWLWSALLIFISIKLGYARCWWVGTLAFPTGATYAKYEHKLTKKAGVFGVILSALLALILFLTGNEFCYIGCYVFIPVFVALATSLLPVERLNCKVVSFLSLISYEIYLCQGIAMECLHGRFICISNNYLYIASVYTTTILLAWLIHQLANKLQL